MSPTSAANFASQRWLLASLLFLHCLLAIAWFISDSFTGSGFDESVVYFLHTGADGLSLSGFGYLIGSAGLLLILCLLAFIRFGRSHWLKTRSHYRGVLRINITLLALLFAQPVFHGLVTEPVYLLASGRLPAEVDLRVPAGISLPAKQNIVFIYLEGFERTLLDEALFPGLAPNLQALEREALAFTNIGDVYGTTWTIGGMVASQCGLPLEPVADVNRPGSFMPKAVCLGDILKHNGYQTSYLGGASTRFGGKGNFYRTHQFDRVVGLEQHLESMPLGTTPYSHWGLYDEDLFRLAGDELQRLDASGQPFAFFMLTLDTHPPDGLPSASCSDIVYADGDSPMLNAYHCSDQMVGEFVRELLKSSIAENSLIVIASDHLALANGADAQLHQAQDRRNLFLVLKANREPEVIDRQGSLLDIAPTLLSLLDAEMESFNLGRSLFSNEPTFVEEMEYPDKTMRAWTSRSWGQFY